MSQPWVKPEESLDVLAAASAAHLVPVSDLRQTFFDDLDASSRVNLKRRLQVVATDDATSLYDMQRAMSGTATATAASRDSSQPSVRRTAVSEGRSSTAGDRPSFFDDVPLGTDAVRATLGAAEAVIARGGLTRLVQGLGEDEAPPCNAAQTTRATQRSAQLFVRNGLAGVLCGVMTKRVARKLTTFVASGLLITKLLCMSGYAQVRWHDLLHDFFISPLRRCCSVGGAARLQDRLLHLERSIEESMGSYWLAGVFAVGAAGSFFLS